MKIICFFSLSCTCLEEHAACAPTLTTIAHMLCSCASSLQALRPGSATQLIMDVATLEAELPMWSAHFCYAGTEARQRDAVGCGYAGSSGR